MRRFAMLTVVLVGVTLPAALSCGADCTGTSTGITPLNDLGAGLYLGQFQGGLYMNGSNLPPQSYHQAAVQHALNVGPVDVNGNPDPQGKYVLLSIGMSNTTQEFCSQNSLLPCDPWTFMGKATTDPRVNHSRLVIVNGARGGQSAPAWDDPSDPVFDEVEVKLNAQGLSEAQVRAVWVKQANAGPTASLPALNADAYQLLASLGAIARAVTTRYPNCELMFVSSRIYAGYASTQLNPEPYAYENGFSIKWLIEAQFNQMNGGGISPIAGDLEPGVAAPFITWGPYLWADGLMARSDGLVWECADFQNDGTHPAIGGEDKVGTMLLEFLLANPYSRPWFAVLPPGCAADADQSGAVDVNDITFIVFRLGQSGTPGEVEGDVDLSGTVDVNDISFTVFRLGAACG